MMEICKGKHLFNLKPISKTDALNHYKTQNNEYKIELIEKLQEVNGSLSFCELPSIIEKTFKIMGLTKYCDTFENQEAALEQLT